MCTLEKHDIEMLWVEKYKPKTIEEIVGNRETIESFIKWLKEWRPGAKHALLYGPPGVGKTLTVELVAKELNYELIELNASDVRTEEAIRHAIGPASRYGSISGYGGRLIFIDEVDGISTEEDRGGLSAILKLLNESRVPIVLAANDPWDPKLRPLREACLMMRFNKARSTQIVPLLKKVCKLENVKAEEGALKILAELAEGDVRSALNDLQIVAQGRRELRLVDVEWLKPRSKQYGAFDVLKMLFMAKSVEEAKEAVNNSLIDYETLLQWIHENLPLQYEDPEELAKAYDALSLADVYLGRAKRTQRWEYMRYFFDLMSAGVALAKKGGYHFVKYQFPKKILMMAQTKKSRELREEAAAIIASKCHLSRSAAKVEVIPFLNIMLKTSMGKDLARWLGLSKEAVELLIHEE